MINGTFWTVEFKSSVDTGAGVVAFNGNRIYGGDNQYYYLGTYEVQGENLNADIKVSRHFEVGESVFGTNEEEFNLRITGKAEESIMTAHGFRPENPSAQIALKFTRRA